MGAGNCKEPSGPDCLCTAFLGTPGGILAPTDSVILCRLQNQIHRPAPVSSLKPVTNAPDRLDGDPVGLEPRSHVVDVDIHALRLHASNGALVDRAAINPETTRGRQD